LSSVLPIPISLFFLSSIFPPCFFLFSFSSFFFFLIPPPPPSTLFPYTTLFRSPHSSGCAALRVSRIAHRDDRDGTCHGSLPREPDRKSTRLNSSHGSISYAVFCLKKKKKKANKPIKPSCDPHTLAQCSHSIR